VRSEERKRRAPTPSFIVLSRAMTILDLLRCIHPTPSYSPTLAQYPPSNPDARVARLSSILRRLRRRVGPRRLQARPNPRQQPAALPIRLVIHHAAVQATTHRRRHRRRDRRPPQHARLVSHRRQPADLAVVHHLLRHQRRHPQLARHPGAAGRPAGGRVQRPRRRPGHRVSVVGVRGGRSGQYGRAGAAHPRDAYRQPREEIHLRMGRVSAKWTAACVRICAESPYEESYEGEAVLLLASW
jgi:hypothetical protein